jgi:hypothetical protein
LFDAARGRACVHFAFRGLNRGAPSQSIVAERDTDQRRAEPQSNAVWCLDRADGVAQEADASPAHLELADRIEGARFFSVIDR